jgi:hypothetical protein
MTVALLIVPPLLKYAAGPLLGPALLAGAGRGAGHDVQVLDLNIRFLLAHLGPVNRTDPERVFGDHARPAGGLAQPAAHFEGLLGAIALPEQRRHRRSATLTLPLGHDEVDHLADQADAGPLGQWIDAQLSAHEGPPPALVGVSVLYSGQVLAGLAATLAVRRRWPQAQVFWGGPHITALRDVIPGDPRFGRLIDGFVFGAAEGTFVELLDAVERGGPWPSAVVRAGAGAGDPAQTRAVTLPHFDSLDLYGLPKLTLPAQTGRGCAYGRCTFCTYPAIEGAVTDLGLSMLDAVVELATAHGAAVALKDSLLLPGRLDQIADRVDGRVWWAGSTKLHPLLTEARLGRLGRAGLRTLEFGLETLSGETQGLIEKRQPQALLERVLSGCAAAGVHPIINLITGFPGEAEGAGEDLINDVQLTLEKVGGPDFGQIEHNRFELERLAPLARDPRMRVRESWPWASVMDWEWVG